MHYRKSIKEVSVGKTIAQPNQAFTPRQILEQFARNEVVPSYYSPSDNIDETTASEDDMLNAIEFEDKIDAEAHLLENQYQLIPNEIKKDNESPTSTEISSGTTETSD